MGRLCAVFALLLTTFDVSVHFAQETPTALKPAPLEVPDGDAAWAVRVIRTGGLRPSVVDITVASTGEVTCGPSSSSSCKRTLDSKALEPIASLTTAKTMPKTKSQVSPSCRDCVVTRLTIRRREPMRKVQTYFAYWDDVTVAKAPFEFVRVATEVVSLEK
jgi:hypothetical protein